MLLHCHVSNHESQANMHGTSHNSHEQTHALTQLLFQIEHKPTLLLEEPGGAFTHVFILFPCETAPAISSLSCGPLSAQ